METGIRWKILKEHKKDCDAVNAVKEREWSTPWCLLGQEWKGNKGWNYRNRIGSMFPRDRIGGEPWLRAVCCDPDCSAQLIVNENDILFLITAS